MKSLPLPRRCDRQWRWTLMLLKVYWRREQETECRSERVCGVEIPFTDTAPVCEMETGEMEWMKG